MHTKLSLPLLAVLLFAPVVDAQSGPHGSSHRSRLQFGRIATFVVPGGGVAEIVASIGDGDALIYSDSGAGKVGIVDIRRADRPQQLKALDVCGSPEDQRTCYCVNPDRLAELKRLVGSL